MHDVQRPYIRIDVPPEQQMMSHKYCPSDHWVRVWVLGCVGAWVRACVRACVRPYAYLFGKVGPYCKKH